MGGVTTVTKTQVIKLCDFMDESYKKKTVQSKKKMKAYSYIYINPWVLFDPTVCIIGGTVLVLAMAEKVLNNQGHYHIVAKMEMIRGIVLPALAVFAIGYVLIHNPIWGWL